MDEEMIRALRQAKEKSLESDVNYLTLAAPPSRLVT